MGLKDSASDAEGAKPLESSGKATVTQSKTFRDGLIYLYQRSDFKKPTWMCRVKVPGGKGYVNRSTGTGDEHKAFKFADDLYNQLLVKSLTGEAPVGKRMGPVIDAYVKRLEPQKDRLSIHYKILLMKRVKPFLDRKTFEELTTSTLSKLADDQASKTKKGSLSPNSVKRMNMHDLTAFLSEHWKAISAAVVTLVGGGIALRFRVNRQSDSSSSYADQRNAKAGGDIVGRDKISKN